MGMSISSSRASVPVMSQPTNVRPPAPPAPSVNAAPPAQSAAILDKMIGQMLDMKA